MTIPEAAVVERWLDNYMNAWERRDEAAFLSLFADDVSYQENPWAGPSVGIDGLRSYVEWSFQQQHKINVTHRLITSTADVAVAHWTVSFEWVSSGVKCEIDGIFVMRFGENNKCNDFSEWQHYRETFEGQLVERIGHDGKWSYGKREWWRRVASDAGT